MKSPADLDLLQAYLDGQLADVEIVALETRLRAEPALADLLLSLAREEAVLTEWGRTQAIGAEIGNEACLVDAELTPAELVVAPARRSGRWIPASVAIAAAVLVALFLFGGHDGKQPPIAQPEAPAFAHLVDTQGEVYVVAEGGGEPVLAQRGQVLKAGQSLKTRGEGSSAIVTLADARRVELGNDTTVRLIAGPPTATDSGAKLYLEEGSVAPEPTQRPEDRPMILGTQHYDFVIPAESRVTITSGSKGTRVEQETGKSQVVNKKDGKSVDVPSGWFAIVPAHGSGKVAPQPMPPAVTQPRLIVREGIGPFQSAAHTPDGSLLAMGGQDGMLRLLNLSTQQLETAPIKIGRAPIRAVAYAPSGALLAASADERQVKLYASPNGQETAVLKGFKGQVVGLAFSADGSLLATVSAGKVPEIKIWSVEAQLELANLPAHGNGILALAFAPDGRTLATAGRDGTVRLWDVLLNQERLSLTAHSAPVNTLAFSPDGSVLATAGKDQTLRLWDTATGQERRAIAGVSGEIRSLAFSADGKYLAAADNNIRLIDLTTAQQLLTYKGHRGAVCSVFFSADSKQLISASWDRTVRVWDVVLPAPAGTIR